MALKRRTLVLLVGGVVGLISGLAGVSPLHFLGARFVTLAQEQAPNRREITLTAKNYRFSPTRIEVAQDDLVKLTVQSEDVAYSVTIDEYRVSRRVPAGGTTTLEFRADRTGTFTYYSNLTSDARHAQMKGEIIVRAR
jgi:heme/copper-type cytochrome/quinol oxidase subunit 2